MCVIIKSILQLHFLPVVCVCVCAYVDGKIYRPISLIFNMIHLARIFLQIVFKILKKEIIKEEFNKLTLFLQLIHIA